MLTPPPPAPCVCCESGKLQRSQPSQLWLRMCGSNHLTAYTACWLLSYQLSYARLGSTPPEAHVRALLLCLLQWPSLLRAVSPAMPDLPAMVQDKYRTCQTMCFCGVFPEIRRAWASVDNSLFLWRYDRRYGSSGSSSAVRGRTLAGCV